MVIELPAAFLSQILLNRMKRRTLLGGSFILTSISITSTLFIPETYTMTVQFCFLVGKGSISIVFTIIYLFTAEQFHTNIRNTIMNTCSMIGRIGSMLAPFVVIMVNLLTLEKVIESIYIIFFIIIYRIPNMAQYPLYYLVYHLLLQHSRLYLIQKHFQKSFRTPSKMPSVYN